MSGDVLKWIEQKVWELEKEHLKWDRRFLSLEEERERLERRFREVYGENHVLVREINQITDAYVSIAEYQNALRLFPCIQIGLALGGVDLLGALEGSR